jgi:hypothetical protein
MYMIYIYIYYYNYTDTIIIILTLHPLSLYIMNMALSENRLPPTTLQAAHLVFQRLGRAWRLLGGSGHPGDPRGQAASWNMVI